MSVPTPQRGVASWEDLRPLLRIDPYEYNVRFGAKRGAFYLQGQREHLMVAPVTWTQTVTASGLHRFTLPARAGSPVLASAQIAGQSLTPVYNSVALAWSGPFVRAGDGLYEHDCTEVYPVRVTDQDRNLMVRVRSRGEVATGRYWLDAERAKLVVADPGCLIDGIRFAPTLAICERLSLERDYTSVISRYLPDPSTAYAVTSAGTVLIPSVIEGTRWIFSGVREIGPLEVYYFVPNSYCLYGSTLELYLTTTGLVSVRYDTSDHPEVWEEDPLNLMTDFRETRIVCVPTDGSTRHTLPAEPVRQPASIRLLLDETSCDSYHLFGVVAEALVEDAHGVGVPMVSVQFSVSNGQILTSNGTLVSSLQGYTDQDGVARVLVLATGTGRPSVTASAGSLSASGALASSKVRSPFDARFAIPTVVAYRLVDPSAETDMVVILIADAHGGVLKSPRVTILPVGDWTPQVDRTHHRTSYSKDGVLGFDLPAEDNMLVIRVPKHPVSFTVAVWNATDSVNMPYSARVLMEEV